MNMDTNLTIGATAEFPGNDADGRNWVGFVHNANDRSVYAESRGATEEEAAQVARLISAAPDLLAALQAFEKVDDFSGWHPNYRDAIEAARAAIRKATK